MCAFDDWTMRRFAGQIRRWKTQPLSNRTSLGPGGFANKSGPCPANEAANLQLWATQHLSEATTQTGPSHHEGTSGVSVKPPMPVSPAAQPRAFKGIFGYFCFQDKSDSPISLRSKRGETVFSGFCAAKPCF